MIVDAKPWNAHRPKASSVARGAQTRPLGPPPTGVLLIALTVAVLVMLGLVMVFSASAITSLHRGNSPWRIFNRQLLVGLHWCNRDDRLSRERLITAGGASWCRCSHCAFALMTLPFVPGLGSSVNDARAWVFIGPVGFQPSEFLKLAILLYCADLLARREKEMANLARTLKPAMMVAGFGAAMCLLQGDLGSAIVLAAIVFAVAFIGGTPMTPILFAGLAGGLSLALFIITSPRRYNRFTAFLDITGNKDHLSFQVYQAMIGMATGGPTGTGIGSGPSKWGYLPACPQRLHLCGHWRGTWSGRSRCSDRRVLAAHLLWRSSCQCCSRSIRNAARWRYCCLAGGASLDQCRWRELV